MRVWLRDHQNGADALGAGILTVLALIGLRIGVNPSRSDTRFLLGQVLVVSMFVPLARRRHEASLVLWVVSIAACGIWMTGFADGITAVAGAIAFYSAGRYGERPTSVWAFAMTTTLLAIVSGVMSVVDSDRNEWFAIVGRCGLVAGSFWFGDSQRSRVALLQSLRFQAARAELERADEARRAVLDERNRIARELHDVVAHSLSVMVIQATAAERMLVRDPAGASASIVCVADVGRSALGEMRRIFGILDGGTGPADYAPQPGLADLEPLIDQCRSAGLDVTFIREGTAPAMSAGMELSLVRVVQESLTNVMKHAGRATATVRITFSDQISVEVSDDGVGTTSAIQRDPRGRGLVGMRERVEALDGTFRVGPRPGGGFVVRADLPVDCIAAQSVDPDPQASEDALS